MVDRDEPNTCDVCGAPAPHCIGGEEYYCDECTPYDTFDLALGSNGRRDE